MRALALIASLAFCGAAFAFPQHEAVPGGVAVIALPALGETMPEAWFGEEPVLIARDAGVWKAVVGLPIGQKVGPAVISWRQGSDGGELAFGISDKDYPTQTLSVEPKFVEPDPQTLVRIGRERERINEVKAIRSQESPALDFLAPAEGPLSSRYGLRRVFNGQPRSPHLGLDIAVPEGTPVRAPAAGEVVDVGDYFFWGNFVAVDHGGGLLTLYAHLSRVDVAPGQRLAKGEHLGLVGKTGRVTGAHLHWTVVLNGQSVNPELFLPPAKNP